jgi:hypothetical protein
LKINSNRFAAPDVGPGVGALHTENTHVPAKRKLLQVAFAFKHNKRFVKAETGGIFQV